MSSSSSSLLFLIRSRNDILIVELLELVPDRKKGELHLLQLERVREGSTSKKELIEILQNDVSALLAIIIN